MSKILLMAGLTGGSDSDLDYKNGADLSDMDAALVITPSGDFYVYLLDADSGLAESSPDVIEPDTNAGDKRWILQAKLTGNELQSDQNLGDVGDAATAFAAIKQAATTGASGVAALATLAMLVAGADDATIVTPKQHADYHDSKIVFATQTTSGAWSVTGVGFKATHLECLAYVPGVATKSHGFSDEDLTTYTMWDSSSSGTPSHSFGVARLGSATDNVQTDLTSYDADGATFNDSYTGSPSLTRYLMLKFMR